MKGFMTAQNQNQPPQSLADTPAIAHGDQGVQDLASSSPISRKSRYHALGRAMRKVGDVGLSVLNGLVGDYLHRQKNPLAVRMGFYADGKPLLLSHGAPGALPTGDTSRICVLVHGLMCDESIWKFMSEGQIVTYGDLLRRDFGYAPFYLRYNTGLHISDNGRRLSLLMARLTEGLSVQEIVFVTHSMGGLVTRSACHHACETGEGWVKKVSRVFYLGSPHLGAPLEKFANAAAFVLKKFPRPYIQVVGDVVNVRSAGIKDLRFGYASDADWKGHDPDAFLRNTKNPLPLMAGVSHYVITGRLTQHPAHPAALLLGDALVRKPSALGKSRRKEHFLEFSEGRHREFPATGHMKLTHCPEVYGQIRKWCEAEV